MKSNLGTFWDQRYRVEGSVWGDEPSPTVLLGARHFRHDMRVLDIGFGYGRDLPFLIRSGCRVVGINPSPEGGRRAHLRLASEGVQAENIIVGRFEQLAASLGVFDAVVSHRVAHLFDTQKSVDDFVESVCTVLRPGGLVVVGARNQNDLDPNRMVRVDSGVYEMKSRSGHRIRYWNDAMFRSAFGRAFDIVEMVDAAEPEAATNPVPCHLTILIGVKRRAALDLQPCG